MKRLIILICSLSLIFISTQLPCYADHPVQDGNKRIVLTFDDGPHPYQTREILDVLDKYHVKATFFVIGINAKHYPGIVGEVLERGHEIGNHTNTHSHAAKLDAKAFENQILACEREIFMQTGTQIKLFRPPEGAINDQMRKIVRDLGYTSVFWTLDTKDWAHTPPEQISQYILDQAKNGDIILMHDYIGANSPTVKALELFIPELQSRGFVFVTVSELLQYKK